MLLEERHQYTITNKYQLKLFVETMKWMKHLERNNKWKKKNKIKKNYIKCEFKNNSNILYIYIYIYTYILLYNLYIHICQSKDFGVYEYIKLYTWYM